MNSSSSPHSLVPLESCPLSPERRRLNHYGFVVLVGNNVRLLNGGVDPDDWFGLGFVAPFAHASADIVDHVVVSLYSGGVCS